MPPERLRSSRVRSTGCSTTDWPKSIFSGRTATLPEVPSAWMQTSTRSSTVDAPAKASRRPVAPGSDTSESGTRSTSGIVKPNFRDLFGRKVHVDLIVWSPRINPACGDTSRTFASLSGIAHSYSTLMRLALRISISRVAEAPTQVGVKTKELESPTVTRGVCPRALTSNVSARSGRPFRTQCICSLCGSVSVASNRNVTSVNDLGGTDPLDGWHENGDECPVSSSISKPGGPLLAGNSKPTVVSPSFLSAIVWNAKSPLTVGGKYSRDPRALNEHLGWKPSCAPWWPCV